LGQLPRIYLLRTRVDKLAVPLAAGLQRWSNRKKLLI
jgi:hypothetical protein